MSEDIEAQALKLTVEQWTDAQAWVDDCRGYQFGAELPPRPVSLGRLDLGLGECEALLAHVRELATGLSEPQRRNLARFNEGWGSGGHGGAIVLRSLSSLHLAEPDGPGRGNLAVYVTSLGRAVLREMESEGGR